MKTAALSPIINLLSGSLNRYLLGGLIVFFMAYSFFIGRTVIVIDQRKDLAKEIQTAQMAVSDLEIEYFNLASSIDMAKALELGFVDSKTPDFAYTHPAEETVALVR
jgi:hypothetical protein